MSPGLPPALRSLLQPQAYPHPVDSVRLIETHISWVLLAGDRAYKIKRPVRYAFVDLRSQAHRAFLCAEELRLNRRFAPELYLDVCPITAASGEARIGGQGEVIEHAVRMRRFDLDEELDRLLAAGRVSPAELEGFGRDLAAIHARLPWAGEADPWGGPARTRTLLLENFEQCVQAAAALGTDGAVRALREAHAQRLERAAGCMAVRRESGCVRECHGDLHTRNVVRHGGRLVAFDCIEFEPAFRWIDTAEEVAFLWMDLQAQGSPAHAQAFLGGHLAHGGDYEACRLLALYAAHRALVRAKVTALEAAIAAPADREALLVRHRTYLDCAARQLAARRPRLVLMFGLSGSGKTWLAARLAPRLAAVHVRSDVERKRLAGLAEQARSASGLAQGLYAPQASERVYGHLERCADHALAGGLDVIVDAALQRRADRERFRVLAARHGADLHLIHCRAPREVLAARIDARSRAATDASEADESVLRWQEAHLEPVGPDEDLAVIEADTTRAEIVAEVLRRIPGAR